VLSSPYYLDVYKNIFHSIFASLLANSITAIVDSKCLIQMYDEGDKAEAAYFCRELSGFR
jgi:hypothetical protein